MSTASAVRGCYPRHAGAAPRRVGKTTTHKPGLEVLENRCCPSIVFQIDYSYDANGFFDANAHADAQERRDTLQLAADTLAGMLPGDLSAITPGPGKHWTATFDNPASGNGQTVDDLAVAADTLVIFAAGRGLGGPLGKGGFGGFTASGSPTWLELLGSRGEGGALDATPTDFGPWGGSISFDTAAVWHFGATTTGLDAGETDFYSVAVHELCHLIGFGTAPSWTTWVDQQNTSFTGPRALAEYDGNGDVPLANDLAHWAAGTTEGGTEALMTPVLQQGTRKELTALDVAGLADVGWRVNHAPTAVDDQATTPPNTAKNIDVLVNDTDPDGDPLQLSITTKPHNGTAAVNNNGTPLDLRDDFLVYTPKTGFHGFDSLVYQVDDRNGGTDTATVTISVNRPPVAKNDAVKVLPATARVIHVLANDRDADGDALTLSVTSPASGGTASVNNNGTPGDPRDDFIVYTPDPGFYGSDSFQYQVADGFGGSATATVTVTIRGVGLDVDPADPAKTALVVVGTKVADVISFRPMDANGSIRAVLTINGVVVSAGTFSPTGHLLAYGQGGNDAIGVRSRLFSTGRVFIGVPAVLDGGGGSDKLSARGSMANNLLVGGLGNDTMTGGGGRDVLIGGLGADILRGGAEADILLGDSTTLESNQAAMLSVVKEWSRTDIDYQPRIDNLTGATLGGDNDPNFLDAQTLIDDGAIDKLFGNTGTDWFLARNSVTVQDLELGEVITSI